MVTVVEYVSECDVRPISEPMPYADALARLRELARHRDLDGLDLISEETHRFMSWAI